MVLFNYPKWVAGQITNPKKNIDKKIFVVGPAGAGKSMTALKLARSIAKWIPYYVKKYYDEDTRPEDYFSIDENHLAIIDTYDLIKLMVTKLRKFSIKVIDDCGASKGYSCRDSMSTESKDLISIYGTNRTDNGVTIIAVQDTSFTDKRLRMLANEVIDLREWYSVYIPKINAKTKDDTEEIRIGKLWKIRMDNEAKYGINECRFMTYERGVWVTQESIACTLPDKEDKIAYDAIRTIKQDAQSKLILETYEIQEKERIQKLKNDEDKCPECKRTSFKYRSRTNDFICSKGHVFTQPIK